MTIVSMMAVRSAPRWLPAKVQLRLPNAMPLNARSAQLLVKQILSIIEEAGEVVPAPEHVVDRFQDLGRAREVFALTQQPDVHVLEKRLALFLAHGAPLAGAAAVDGALDLEQRIEASDRLQRDRRDRFALRTFPENFLDVASSKKPRRAWAKQNAGVIGIAFFCGSNSGPKPL